MENLAQLVTLRQLRKRRMRLILADQEDRAKRRRIIVAGAMMRWLILRSLLLAESSLVVTLLVWQLALRKPERPLIPDMRMDFDRWDDRECVLKTRFYKADLVALVAALRIPEVLRTPGRHHTRYYALEGLVMFLDRLVDSRRLIDQTLFFGRDQSAICKIVNHFVDLVYRTHVHRLRRPPHLTAELAREFGRMMLESHDAPDQRCAFLTDGTDRPICRPSVGQQDFYGRKKRHAIKFLATVTPDGLIVNLQGPVEGRRNDHFMQEFFGVERFVQDICGCLDHHMADHQHLYSFADKGFHIDDHVVVPYRALPGFGLTEQQMDYNRRMAAIRGSVEWAFGLVIREFPKLNCVEKNAILKSRIAQEYIIAALLLNMRICLHGRCQIGDYFFTAPPTLDEYMV